MFIDEKGKIFGKISIVDIFVILLLLGAVAGTYYKFFMVKGSTSLARFDMLQYQVQIRDIRQSSVDAIEEGADVFDGETGNPLGKIVKKEIFPSMEHMVKADGTSVLAEKPNRYMVIATIEVPGIESPYGYFAYGRSEIKRGSDMKLKTRLISVEAKAIDVKKLQ
ncbi:MAG: DUF4330 domain-containing protein [Clostridiaceae bacterium]|nr:DUF4330 domain-containing protein [Clostridiaceae bacterium]